MEKQQYTLPAGTQLFAAGNCESGVEAAKQYARKHDFKKGDVRIRTTEKDVFVIAEKPVLMECIRLNVGNPDEHVERIKKERL